MEQIVCNNVTLGYQGQVVVKNLSFCVSAGDYVCIVGENGAGKTTLIKTLLQLQPPLDGQIIVGEGFAPGDIGYLPQQTEVQRDFPASVREIVLSGCQNNRASKSPFYKKEEKKAAADAMETLGIAELSRRCYRELSGGQQQRVMLARAVCAAKQALLLDEPASGLDPQHAAQMYRLIQKLNRENGMTVLMVSHDITAAVTYATHILHIGDTCFYGTVAEYQNSSVGKRFLAAGGDLL